MLAVETLSRSPLYLKIKCASAIYLQHLITLKLPLGVCRRTCGLSMASKATTVSLILDTSTPAFDLSWQNNQSLSGRHT